MKKLLAFLLALCLTLTVSPFTMAEASENVTELDLSDRPIGSVEAAKEIAAQYPNLETLIVDSTGIPHEEMAAYRDEVRDSYKVVWTIQFSDRYSVRTDTIGVHPDEYSRDYVKDTDAQNLKYLEDCISVDLSYHPVINIDFVTEMPHLKYLNLCGTQVWDLSPISGCKELILLDLGRCMINDYSPLLGCTALEDLNISDRVTPTDVKPLTQMTWLKNLWCPTIGSWNQTILTEALPDTRVVTSPDNKWRTLPNYYIMRDIAGPLCVLP